MFDPVTSTLSNIPNWWLGWHANDKIDSINDQKYSILLSPDETHLITFSSVRYDDPDTVTDLSLISASYCRMDVFQTWPVAS